MQKDYKNIIIEKLKTKAVILTGPRGTGKTTVAEEVAKTFNKAIIFDCGSDKDAKEIEKNEWKRGTTLLVLHNIHKLSNWLNRLFDLSQNETLKVIVVEHMHIPEIDELQKMPEFFILNFYPLSAREIIKMGLNADFDRLMFRSAFREPYTAENENAVRTWRNSYIDTLMRRDIFDFKKFGNFRVIQGVFDALKKMVGKPVSFNAMSRDFGVISSSIQRYINLLEELNLVFRLTPYSGTVARSLTKRSKIYFYDSGLVEGTKQEKFENLIAIELMNEAARRRAFNGTDSKLYYLRTKDGLCVDFCMVENGTIRFLVEGRVNDTGISKNIRYFCRKYGLEGMQVVKNLRLPREEDGVKTINALEFCKDLGSY